MRDFIDEQVDQDILKMTGIPESIRNYTQARLDNVEPAAIEALWDELSAEDLILFNELYEELYGKYSSSH